MRFLRAIVIFVGVGLWLGAARAQIVEGKKVGNKTILCSRSGLVANPADCGGRGDWYNYVFVGSITALSPADKGEKKLQIHPEEIFHGNPPAGLTVLTSQGLCLPKLAVGDPWLFYLREEKGKPIVLDYYGNGSRPAVDATEEIKTLRRLKTIGNRGIVRGLVSQGPNGRLIPVVHAVVIAHGPGGSRFFTRTDSQGRYEFPPLPAGEYKIVAINPTGSFRSDDENLGVTAGSCSDLGLSRSH